MQKIKNKNGTFFREKIYIDGKPIFSPRFTRKSDAQNWKARFKTEKMTYQATGQKTEVILKVEEEKIVRSEITLNDYAMMWVNTRVKLQLAVRTHEQYLHNLKAHILPKLGHIKLHNIRREHADEIIETLARKGHNSKGINIILGVFKRVMSEAMREDKITKNPLLQIRELKEQRLTDNYLTHDEIKRFLDVSKGHYLYSLFLLAVNTGMRRGELAGLTWSRINFERNQIEIANLRDRYGLMLRTKSITSKRFVPMNYSVRQHLQELKELADPEVEVVLLSDRDKPFNVDHLYVTFKRFLKLAKIRQTVRFHDLRHTFASHFMMNGGNIYDLQKILGHSSLEMTQRYAHLAPDHLVKASNVVSFGAKLEEKNLKIFSK